MEDRRETDAHRVPCRESSTSPAGGLAAYRRLELQESALAEALRNAESELERSMRAAWLACVREDVASEVPRARCEALQREAERLERELRHVRAALLGRAEELAERARTSYPDPGDRTAVA